jgi:DNA-binding response OmpR family regulator
MNQTLSILIVEDDQHLADALDSHLTAQGHCTFMAYDGEHAIEFAQSVMLDIFLFDLGLPGISGIEAARQILAEHSVPAIVITGASGQAELEKITELNVQAYLVKPFTLAQLDSAIEIALAQHSRLEQAHKEISGLKSPNHLFDTIDTAARIAMKRSNLSAAESYAKISQFALMRGHLVAKRSW